MQPSQQHQRDVSNCGADEPTDRGEHALEHRLSQVVSMRGGDLVQSPFAKLVPLGVLRGSAASTSPAGGVGRERLIARFFGPHRVSPQTPSSTLAFHLRRWHRRRRGQEGDGELELDDVSPALRNHLGPGATLGLVALLDKARHQWSAAVTESAVDRFDARLTAEISGLRIEVKQDSCALRAELKQDISDLRVELKQDINDLRVELKQKINDLHVELTGNISQLDTNVSTALLNQTRWMFGMWVGQLAATAAIVAGMFRIFVP